MRHTELWLRLLLAATIALGAVVAWAAARLAGGDGTEIHSAITGIGLALLAVLLIVTVIVWKNSRLARRARRPDQRVTEWTVSPATWAAFVETDKRREAETPEWHRVWKPRRRYTGGQVICAKGGFLIDGLMLGIEPRGINGATGIGWLQAVPECLEVATRIVIGTGSTIRTYPALYRIPVEPAAREAAIAAYHHYEAFIRAGALSDPAPQRRAVRIAMALAVVCWAVGGLGFVLEGTGAMPGSDLPALMGLVGVLTGSGAAFVAFVVWLAMLRR